MPATLWPDGGLADLEPTLHAPVQRSKYAPPWSERLSDRINWCAWLLEVHPEVYTAFERAADARRAGNPDRRIGVDAILNELRWDTGVRVLGDGFKLNNNARALLARLYLRARPDAKLETRKSWLDTLDANEWAQIIAAWKRGAR